MRSLALVASAVLATLSVTAEAAPPGTAAGDAPPTNAAARDAAGDDPITFEQYRDWRLTFTERRRTELAVQLSAADLSERQKTRLQESRAYYDWLAGLPDAERDRRFRERFDRIDTNHDGKIDAAERAAWRDKQRAYYDRNRSGRDQRADQRPAAEAR